ncbi:MAG: efflux RND transporter periplasmic adaptor subunit [Bryobacteraceae bacterium]|nr:efflux RND transporter periplasmic adaptor subunit [Bryobacteraceae bacterium]
MKRLNWIAVILVLLCGGAYYAYRQFGPNLMPVSAAPEIPVTTVKRGDVTFHVNAEGELQGGATEMLIVPMTGSGTTAITYLRQNGELVKKGDQVVKLDTTEQDFKLREAEADLAEAEQQVIQAKAESDARIEEIRYALLQAQADLKIAELEAKRNEILPRLTARQNELAVDAARDRLTKLESDLENRRKTAITGVAIQETAQARAKVRADTARKNIASMTLVAKTSGYVALQSNDEGNFRWGMYLPPYQVGDQARPGKGVAQIPDMTSWEGSARIGELDRGHLAEGQAAEVEVVAMPGRKFAGQVKAIGGTTGPPWERRFECRIGLQQPDLGMRPGMSARFRIVTGTARQALWVPSQALFEADGRKFVYVRTPTGFVPQDVKLERRSESQVVITGVREGLQVALANPTDLAKKRNQKSSALQALPQ